MGTAIYTIYSGNKKDVGKAVSLLREAANLLAGDRESEGNEDTASSATLGISCEAAVTNSNPAPSSNQDRVLQNFRTLFAGYRSTSPAASSFTKRSQTKSFPPGKRSRPSGQGYYKVRETWMRDFLYLADKDLQVAPTKGDKLALLAAGLGRKKLTFGQRRRTDLQGEAGRCIP